MVRNVSCISIKIDSFFNSSCYLRENHCIKFKILISLSLTCNESSQLHQTYGNLKSLKHVLVDIAEKMKRKGQRNSEIFLTA